MARRSTVAQLLELNYNVVLPEQLLSRPDSQTGPRALMVAVLADALRSIQGTNTTLPDDARRKGYKGTTARQQAFAWFFARPSGWLYDFENICDVLGISAPEVRKVIQRRGNLRDFTKVAGLRKFRRINRSGIGNTLTSSQ